MNLTSKANSENTRPVGRTLIDAFQVQYTEKNCNLKCIIMLCGRRECTVHCIHLQINIHSTIYHTRWDEDSLQRIQNS